MEPHIWRSAGMEAELDRVAQYYRDWMASGIYSLKWTQARMAQFLIDGGRELPRRR
jgi:hypothetical protein